jgi:hypothetical protein
VVTTSTTAALGGVWPRLAAPTMLADAFSIDCARGLASHDQSLAEARR